MAAYAVTLYEEVNLMREVQPQAIFLKDYEIPDFLIDKTQLIVDLNEEATTVTSTLQLRRNPQSKTSRPLKLHGQCLELISVTLDGQLIAPENYQISEDSLQLSAPDHCQLTTVIRIKPQENTSLEGLYRSQKMYCTQCEAEGFRKITYYLDRPDVMSEFTTKIIADKQRYPVLLSNGNRIDGGELDGGRHWASWHDPFKKPAYLFALVAGDLSFIEDSFVTASGRRVALKIFVEPKDLDKCDHAMQSLKKAMRWDEEVYGREYDLDIFMIVAVDDFNMGAMENKGLNIFNTSCVLAHPQTTTDAGFQRVEGVVAHEYFHNWSGNRVTCRDWFQLSLKEGFTVFRDQCFSADMGSPTVKRVEDVGLLRTLQFAEDSGPMAHPVRPPSFIEISNFYTLTVYEKGSEIVRMLHTLLSPEVFRKGSDLYFDHHDGQAATIDDFIDSMEQVSGRDFSQFMHWYGQAGTPIIKVDGHYDELSKTYEMRFTQIQPDTPESRAEEKSALHMPIAMGLLGKEGALPLKPEGYDLREQADQTHWVFELVDSEQTLRFTEVDELPVPSLLRNFSAPVRLQIEHSRDDQLRLMRRDSDGFCRWNASQQLAVSIIHEQMAAIKQGRITAIDDRLSRGYATLLAGASLDKAMVALMMTLPSEAYLAEIAEIIEVEAIHNARESLLLSVAQSLREPLWECYQSLASDTEYQYTAKELARRSLKNTALGYLMRVDEPRYHESCLKQYQSASNMTDSLAALRALVHSKFSSLNEIREKALNDFYQRWKGESLVVNQWLSLQATIPRSDTLDRVRHLMKHPCFSIKNPNKVRALIGAFCGNRISFHQSDGSGYRFLAEQVIALNRINPQIASRLLTPLTRWRKYPDDKQVLICENLQQILKTDGLSKDVYEIVTKSLATQS
ncbi:MAG: aminopeptidase N [Cellvibrionaceae bacterium]|jgi:aminopeptidase N